MDVVIAIVLVVAVVASIVGAITYEDGRLGSARFDVSWASSVVELDPVTASQAGGGEVELRIPVNVSNLTALDVLVAIEDASPRAQPTAVRLELTPPGGGEPIVQEGEVPVGGATTIEIALHADVGEAPNATSTTGASLEAAHASLAAEHTNTNGTGEWVLVVSLAPGLPGPLGAQASHSVSAAASATIYSAEARPVLPEVEQR